MKLEDVLSIVSESRNLYVWENGEIIAQYDGRDSILTRNIRRRLSQFIWLAIYRLKRTL